MHHSRSLMASDNRVSSAKTLRYPEVSLGIFLQKIFLSLANLFAAASNLNLPPTIPTIPTHQP